MKAIRGAVTVKNDTPESIKKAVGELLNKIKTDNELNAEQFICIMFSNTSDLISFYPAKAAREAGFAFCALYSSLEPDIEGALKKCIRVMVLADTDKAPKHVYLGEAANLRKDLTKSYAIAIDGPAGSGKSSVAKELSKRLNILYLDTGAMYRAIALLCLNSGVDIENEREIEKTVSLADIQINYVDGKQVTLLNGANVSEEIRKPEISNLASKISSYGCVREKLTELQRKIASNTSCVLDGRDIGTNVLPNAEYKFYLTASDEIRAERRFKENWEKGYNVPLHTILSEIRERDERDKNRKIAPLKCADDAIVLDTSYLDLNEVVESVLKHIQEKV